MLLFLKKYAGMFYTDEVLTQYLVTERVETEEDLQNYPIAKLSVPVAVGIGSDDFITLCDADRNDFVIFRGIVGEVKNNITSNGSVASGVAELTVYGEKSILQRRHKIGADQTFTGQTLQYIIETILAPYIAIGETRSVNTSFITTTNIEVKEGDDVYGVIDELCGEFGLLWRVDGGVITIGTTVGYDYSSGGAGVEIYYNGKDSFTNNVESFVELQQNTRYSAVICKDKAGTKYMYPESLASLAGQPFYGVFYQEFRNWNLQQKTVQKYNEVSVRQPIYQIVVERNTLDVNIGDILKITIENVSSNIDGIGALTVVKKKFLYDNGVVETTYNISEAKATVLDEVDFFKRIYTQIKKQAL